MSMEKKYWFPLLLFSGTLAFCIYLLADNAPVQPSGSEALETISSASEMPEIPDHRGILDQTCNTCHDGSGFGTTQHDNSPAPAEVHILERYNSSRGSSNAIVENLDCTKCHSWKGGEATSITSAGHHEHINSPMDRMAHITCTYCHDPNLVRSRHKITATSLV